MANNMDRISWLLGSNLDGWADLIEGMGDKAEEVYRQVIDQLKQREMPDIQVTEMDVKEGFLSNLHRTYAAAKTYPGVRTLIYVKKHGHDLYTSWKCFIRPTFNWRLLLVYAAISLGLSLIIGAILLLLSLPGVLLMSAQQVDLHTFSSLLVYWILYGVGIGIGLLILTSIIGSIVSGIKKRWRFCARTCGLSILSLLLGLVIALFIQTNGQSMFTELQTLNSTISQGMQYMAIPFSFPSFAVTIFIVILVIAAFTGFIVRRNFLAYILKEPSVFDADDITAMNLTVHKTILRVLDAEGIDASKLRLKREFKGGRSGDVV